MMLYNYNQALDDLENALNIDPENVLALENRGEVYRCLAMYHRALTDFDKSLEIEPESVFALTQRGRAYNDLSISILEHSHANMKHQKWSNDHIDYIRPVELSDIEFLWFWKCLRSKMAEGRQKRCSKNCPYRMVTCSNPF